MLTGRMSAKEAQDNFSDIVSRAYYRNEPTIVERQGKPMAVVISPEQYEQFRQQATREMFDTIRDIHDRSRDADPDEIEADIARAIAEVRQKSMTPRNARRPKNNTPRYSHSQVVRIGGHQ